MMFQLKRHDEESDSECGQEEEEMFSVNEQDDNQESAETMKRVKRLARKETRRIKVWRMIVLVTLIAAGAAVCSFTYIFLREEEKENFVTSYFMFVNTIHDITEYRAAEVSEAFRATAERITAHANKFDESFPFVTVPNFEVMAKNARERASLETLNYLPLVKKEDSVRWGNYTTENFAIWHEQSKAVRLAESTNLKESDFLDIPVSPEIFSLPGLVNTRDSYAPIWLSSPPPLAPIYTNLDFYASPLLGGPFAAIEVTNDVAMTPWYNLSLNGWDTTGSGLLPEEHDILHDATVERKETESTLDRPHVVMVAPVFNELGNGTEVSAYLFGQMAFDTYLKDLLPDGIRGIHAVFRSNCGLPFSYELTGSRAVYLGVGDLHEPEYDGLLVPVDFTSYRDESLSESVPSLCRYTMDLYPTSSFESTHHTIIPTIFLTVVSATFGVMVAMFVLYDFLVEQRNKKLVDAFTRAATIVSGLFPSKVQDQLYEQTAKAKRNEQASKKLQDYLDNGEDQAGIFCNDDLPSTKPIAEFFAATTIMFCDISGFTAWSSSREPSQVFMLLETLYHSFDEIAKRRGVFKVETIGDCYVAVCGLPEPRKDHALVMVRFARDCLAVARKLMKKLEVSLGPDTCDLSMRAGLHSGPVTAGVLRGERSRFQLFGDTMNTASRMESTGESGRVHLSQETADQLFALGKQHWVAEREQLVSAKGKGQLKTYWLMTTAASSKAESERSNSIGNQSDSSDRCHSEDDPQETEHATMLKSGRVARLVEWNADMLAAILKQIVAQNAAFGKKSKNLIPWNKVPTHDTILDEVKETISLPPFKEIGEIVDPPELSTEVRTQLQSYVFNIAAMYQLNPFHNFEHASHVTMSVTKLLSRIVAPADIAETSPNETSIKKDQMASRRLHDHTYGITSDPLTQFACVLSALIHDVDHPGVPNSQLIRENPELGKFYKNKSVAEQNSVDLAWNLLQDDGFSALRAAIHPTEETRSRFRQLVVNAVMATDILDQDLKRLRNARWERAFCGSNNDSMNQDSFNSGNDRKATIVIEHLIQASDVAHTMQHWHVYRKWNERLFRELYQAYAAGRSTTDPSETWYSGELGFFDHYIIPLAKKLEECGVFGVSSDECLNYAIQNRAEWADRGETIVAEMIEKVRNVPGYLTAN